MSNTNSNLKVGSSDSGLYVGNTEILGGGLAFLLDNLKQVIGSYKIILYINTNNHDVNFILDDTIQEVIPANSVHFINTHETHFLNMSITENVYMYIYADDGLLPMESYNAGTNIPTDMTSGDGVIIIISRN